MTKPKRFRRTLNLALAGVASLAGFVAVGITFAALFAGLWLDSRTGRHGTFTTICLFVSVPISVYVMYLIVKRLVGWIVPQPYQRKQSIDEEETH